VVVDDHHLAPGERQPANRAFDRLGDLAGPGFARVLLDVRATTELPARDRARANAVRGGVPESVSLLDVRA
jgi:hypothetical protein